EGEGRRAREGEGAREDESPREGEPAAREGEAAVEVRKSTPPAGRPRWAPYFDVTAGASIGGRSFDFAPAALPHFSSGVVGGLRLDLTLYPFAFSHAKLGGVFAGFGLGVTLDKPFWP